MTTQATIQAPPAPPDEASSGAYLAIYERALDVLHTTSTEYSSRFSNHGPMVVEALEALGHPERIPAYVDRSLGHLEPLEGPPLPPISGDWRAALREALPPLLEGLSGHLFHPLIRTGHAVRALERADTPARRRELSVALDYWRRESTPSAPRRGRPLSLSDVSATAAARYLSEPAKRFFYLHGVTASANLRTLLPYLGQEDQARAIAILARAVLGDRGRAGGSRPLDPPVAYGWDSLAASAARGLESHTIKLVQAARLEHAVSGHDALLAAAAHRVATRRVPTRP